MKLLIIVIALLVVYSTKLSGQFQLKMLARPYLTKMQAGLLKLNIEWAPLQLFIQTFIFLLALSLIYALLFKFFYGVFAFLFALFILVTSLAGLHFSFSQSPELLMQNAVRSLFSILFWFIVLGPVGAVLYILIDAIRENYFSLELTLLAQKTQNLLDWIPVRLLAFSFALVGHFSAVIHYWMAHVFTAAEQNDMVLQGSFEYACGPEHLEGKDRHLASEYLIKLIYRSLVLWLVVLALLVLS